MNIKRDLGSFIFTIIILCGYVHTLNDAEIKAEFTKLVLKCLKEHPVEPMELIKMKQLIPQSTQGQCLLACAYKLEGTMNAQGLYDLEQAYKVAEATKDGDENRLENARKVADICWKVSI